MKSELGHEYELISPISDEYAELYFYGKFSEDEVRWHLKIYTLSSYYNQQVEIGMSDVTLHHAQQFMEVADGNDAYEITVALAVPRIDEPTIRKCILMIRNYRRLRYGRHEWGVPIPITELDNGDCA